MLDECTGSAWEDALHARLCHARYPLTGQWELTCRCNLTCRMCYTDPFNTPARIRQELATDEILRILHDVADAGCLFLCLTGGEPLARPDFLDIYTAAQQRGLRVTVFTNGTLVTERIADRWVASPPQRIELSLYGMTRETYERITQRAGSYDACLRGIRLLQERALPLIVKSPAMTMNQHEILAMRDWVERQGIHFQFGEWMRPRLDGAEDTFQWQLSEDELRAIASRAGSAWEEHQQRQTREPRCGSARFKFHIDAYGQLQLCSQNRRQSYDLRSGSFREGFYEALPQFPCPNKRGVPFTKLEPAHA